jgi:hypothetical protein
VSLTDPRPPPETVTYWAISLFSSRTFWWNAANGLLAVLSLSDVVAVIPPRFLPLQLALASVVNLYLRSVTVRPVAWIAAGTTTPVDVPRIAVPPPAVTERD